MLARNHPDQILDTAINALTAGPAGTALLDELPAPVYTTDTQGRVTYWNRACVEFAGREPVRGHDRWCLTWQPYPTSGEPRRHDDCPRAPAGPDRQPLRDPIRIPEPPGSSSQLTVTRQ